MDDSGPTASIIFFMALLLIDMFFYGFGFCAIICFFLYLCVSWGVQRCVKDNELVIAIYENKTDKWKITKNFEKIADEMTYSWRQVLRLHGRALQEFEKKYGNTYKMS